ncbi:uncharacterized protein LOC111076069 [Drosophila obscura]|uniref:uncharacterized protein LOC111076069 n=1 Tax=Drosophila obscura TaxID=7282 RepID=UPI001BB16E3D|nr:uncharacterized protein LOC111076069 [Drosophila obscura]
MSSTRKSLLSQITQILVVGYTLRSYTVYEGQGPNRFTRHTNLGHELTRWMNQAAIRRGERMLARDPSQRSGGIWQSVMPERLTSRVKRDPAPERKVEVEARPMAPK